MIQLTDRISHNIQKRREWLGLRIWQAAGRASLTTETWCKLEGGSGQVQNETMRRAHLALQVNSPDDFSIPEEAFRDVYELRPDSLVGWWLRWQWAYRQWRQRRRNDRVLGKARWTRPVKVEGDETIKL